MFSRIGTNVIIITVFLAASLSNAAAQTKLPPTSEPVYHVGGNVTAPRLLYDPAPEYSDAARSAHQQGVCKLSVVVGSNGEPRDITVSQPLGMGLDEKSVEAVRNWRFEPARREGIPVAVEITVTVSFSLGGHDPKIEQWLEQLQRTPRPPVSVSVEPCPPLSARHETKSSVVSFTIGELNFDGAVQLPISEQEEIAASLKRQSYTGTPRQFDVLETVRAAWQDRGYLKVEVSEDAKILTSSPSAERIALTVHVSEGQQYRLRRITFDKPLVIDMQALRDLFPIKDGDVFTRKAVSDGLAALRKVFGEMGYINFVPVPDARVDDENGLIDLVINMDRGKQFFISAINLVGTDPDLLQNASRDLPLQPGDVYNQRLIELILEKYATKLNPVPDPNHDLLRLDESAGTVAITFDLRNCPMPASSQ
ncbi:MAG TPA: TonB family protein [Terriglobales bacterium]|jgi:TonB family protein|nr:TonB family protein [Terriglobales bacterium]